MEVGAFPIKWRERNAYSPPVQPVLRRSKPCTRTLGMERASRRAAGLPDETDLSAGSRSTPIRLQQSTPASHRQKPISNMRAGSLQHSRRVRTSVPSASTARCTICRISWRREEPWHRSERATQMDRPGSNQLDVSEDHTAIREGVRAVVTRFDDEYWLARDEDGEFPR